MSDFDRIKSSLARLFRPLLRQLDFSALYGATVVSQNADGSLELKASATKLPPMSSVPIRYGIPGVSVLVNAGSLALVGWENADPKIPFAFLWGGGSAIQSLTFLGGNQPIARMGDVISVVFPEVIPFTGTISGLPAEGTITVLPSPAPGIILTGNPNVTA